MTELALRDLQLPSGFTPAGDAVVIFDNTRLEAWRRCKRLYLLSMVKSYQPVSAQPALVFGICLHEALHVLWRRFMERGEIGDRALITLAHDAFMQAWRTEGYPEGEKLIQATWLKFRTPHVALAMLEAYLEQSSGWMASVEPLAVESPLAAPLFEPSHDLHEKLLYGALIDLTVRLPSDRIAFIEHKTSSEFATETGFRSTVLDGFNPNGQIRGQLYLGKLFHAAEFSTCLIDLALVHEKHRRFSRLEVPFSEDALDEWLIGTRQEVAEAHGRELSWKLAGEPTRRAFPQNPSGCIGRYGRCMFHSLCSTEVHPDLDLAVELPLEWKHRPWQPMRLVDFGAAST